MMLLKELIFVYNANSGKMNAMKDYFHKVISPKTYNCNLCSLTYDLLGMKSEWKKAIEKTGLKTVFLHKDELEDRYSVSYELPVILIKEGNNVKTILNALEIKQTRNLNELIRQLNNKLLTFRN